MLTRFFRTLAFVVSLFVIVTECVSGEEPKLSSTEINLSDVSRADDPVLFDLVETPPTAETKVVTYDFNIDQELPMSDTSKRIYKVVCSERHAEQLKEPRQLVEFKFNLDTTDKDTKAADPKPSLVNRFALTLRQATTLRRPVGSKQIAEKVIDALYDARERDQIRGFDIKLEVERGQVTLSGNVPSQEQRQRVARIVSAVGQVQHINNRLEIRDSR
ncbi:MAG TPA: BON domain-containing protein [Pirellulaceae bacterium]|nr:BON domain-containing protein [Pirellulaceae bacterium]